MMLRVLRNLVIRFAAPRQHVGEVGQFTEAGEQLDGAAALRADHGRELSGVHPQLVESVVVEIDFLAREPLVLPQHAFGDRELAPDRGAQVRQVESAEHSMPVRIVALRATDRPPGFGGIATAAG